MNTVLKMHFHRRAIGSLAHPYVQVLAFAGLKKKHIVAVVEFSKLIELVQLRLCIEFCVFAAVRKESVNIVKEMPVTFPETCQKLNGSQMKGQLNG